MKALLNILMTFHIAGGSIGLLTLAAPLLLSKGSTLHKKIGWIFVWGMGLAAGTGALASLIYLSGYGDRRVIGGFFLMISALTAESLWMGIVSVRRKGRAEPQAGLRAVVPQVGLLVLGCSGLLAGLVSGRPLLIVFGALSVLTGGQDLRFAVRPLSSPMAWWYQHMSSMMVASISAVTAFMVFGAGRLTGVTSGLWAWLLPSAIAVPGFVIWTRFYKRKFGDAV